MKNIIIESEINKEDLFEIIKSYYLNKYNKIIEVKDNTRAEVRGYPYEYKSIETTITISYDEVLNINKALNIKMKKELSKKDLIEIFNEYLSASNYEVNNIKFNNGSRLVGYYEDLETYFDGIKLTLSEKEDVLKLKK